MNILITDHFIGKDELIADGHVVKTQYDKQSSKDIDIVITRSKTKIDSKFLDLVPKVKLVITTTSGFEHIDLRECKNRKILCAYTPDANALSAAELTLTLALAATKDIKKAFTNADQNLGRKDLDSQELSGKIWGIVGLGRVGKKLLSLLDALNVKVLVFDPYIENTLKLNMKDSISDLFLESDVISLHVPLTKETKDMITADLIKKMKSHSILINTSRAKVINKDALNSTIIGERKFALDVFMDRTNNKFSKNFILTPHIGGRTHEALKRASQDALEIVREFVTKGTITKNTLPPSGKWYQDYT